MTRDRVLVWDGCVNVRDLSGLPLESRGETRFRVVVRADSIRSLTGRGWRALTDYGVRLAIDPRGGEEVASDGGEETPVPVVHVPITPSMPGLEPGMRIGYLAGLARFRPEFSRAASAVATTSDTVVIHCQGGRRARARAAATGRRSGGHHAGGNPRGGGHATTGREATSSGRVLPGRP